MTDKPRIYICAPFRGNGHATQEENIKYALAIEERLIKDGKVIPIATHGMFPRLNDDDNRELIMDLCKGVLGICDEVWICSRIITPGMAEEIAFAAECNIKTRQMYDEFEGIKIETGGADNDNRR